jgi:GH15 family glucan-1,4-alpha-glucosidase
MKIDASLYGLFAFEALPVDDPRVAASMEAVRKRLWVKTDVGGLARYEGDIYHRVSSDVENVPGNPWFLTTLWLAEYEIARAERLSELERALPILEWVEAHALPSGVLAEQVHPFTNEPLSVSPLTWSHASVVLATLLYLEKRATLTHGERGRAFLHTGKRYAASSCVLHGWDAAERVPEKAIKARDMGVGK